MGYAVGGIENLFSKKWKTLRENPRGVIRKYINLAKLHLFLSNPEVPIFREDYSKHWKADFEGKVVLDLGADYGSTALYFLQKGAGEVIAVEGDRVLAMNLAKNAKGRRITPVYGMVTDPKQLDALISVYKPDVVKVDIEGYESILFGSSLITAVGEWLVEVHDHAMVGDFVKLFYNFDVEIYRYGDITVIHAVRAV